MNEKHYVSREFKQMVDRNMINVKRKFHRAYDDINRMKDDAFSTINGIMTSLGVGLS